MLVHLLRFILKYYGEAVLSWYTLDQLKLGGSHEGTLSLSGKHISCHNISSLKTKSWHLTQTSWVTWLQKLYQRWVLHWYFCYICWCSSWPGKMWNISLCCRPWQAWGNHKIEHPGVTKWFFWILDSFRPF